MRRPKETRRLVVVVAFDRVQLLDLAGPAQAFATAAEIVSEQERPAGAKACSYKVVAVSRDGGLIRTSSGLSFATESLTAITRTGAAIDTLIVAGGPGVHSAAEDTRLVAWVARNAAKVRRVCSVCTGAFLLAAAGVLSGKRAVTHWRACTLLQKRHPDIGVEADPIYIRDGSVWTSAGVTAGIDLALALVEEDLGRRVALQVARRLVVFLKRPGGQSQFSAPLEAQVAAVDTDADGRFAALHAWMSDNLAGDLRVERLAARTGMSPRNFARKYAARIGATPARTVETMRVEAARRALEDNGSSIKQVASACGFGDEERMRRAFLRRVGSNPLDYRRRFSS